MLVSVRLVCCIFLVTFTQNYQQRAATESVKLVNKRAEKSKYCRQLKVKEKWLKHSPPSVGGMKGNLTKTTLNRKIYTKTKHWQFHDHYVFVWKDYVPKSTFIYLKHHRQTDRQTIRNLLSLWDENLTSPPCWLFRMWEKQAHFQFDRRAFLSWCSLIWNS